MSVPEEPVVRLDFGSIQKNVAQMSESVRELEPSMYTLDVRPRCANLDVYARCEPSVCAREVHS